MKTLNNICIILACVVLAVGENGHISQIPGLSPTVKTINDERAQGKRSGVLATDSEFTRLSKQGGHKGLLWHTEILSPSSPHSYKAPSWFSDNGNPSLITASKQKKTPRAFLRREPPFGSDNMSAWERDDGSACTEPQHISNPEIETEQQQQQQQQDSGKCAQCPELHSVSVFARGNAAHATVTVPRVFDKKPAPVDMSTLLSFGYMEDSKPTS
ncbi:uncharacterized protein C7orf57 homolog [Eucyclogobius newberryi]|uniref:uncharacterized protein C7orf57 homolog n=1 Tax=Eucyclogobius newberryi TaxID=166745 RepID=UPI003B5B7775